MRNTILILIAVVIVAALGYWLMTRTTETPSGFTNEGETEMETTSKIPSESVTTMETGSYAVDRDSSTVTFQAGKPAIAGYVHTGQFSLESGSVDLSDDSLTGEFVVDMSTLVMLSLGGGKAGQETRLEGHLKGENFFNVEEYPSAVFSITDVSPKVLAGPGQAEYTATGELTMKGVTKEVGFPIEVIVASENEVWMSGELEIDRTEWGIDFGSASVVNQITDQVIGDTVQLDINVKLTK